MLNGTQGLHRVCKKLASGKSKSYWYFGRGGPPIVGQPTDPAFWKQIYGFANGRHLRTIESRRLSRAALHKNKIQSEGICVARMFMNARDRALKAGLQFSITKDFISRRLQEQSFRCAVSGARFDLSANVERLYSRNPMAPSLDRINNLLGYSPENVRIVSWRVNVAINEWGLESFVAMCREVNSFSHFS